MPKSGMDTYKSWAMAIISSFIFGINVATAKLASLLFVASITRYGISRSSASLPFTVCFFMRNATGPFIGYLGQRFGIRAVTIFGCILSSVAIAGAFFAEDIITLTISWGIIYGTGYGLSVTLLPEIVTQYFDRHMSKAYGVYNVGLCFLSTFFPIICKVLLKTYGLSGTFLILSGIIMQGIPASMLLKVQKSVCKKYSKETAASENVTFTEERIALKKNNKKSLHLLKQFRNNKRSDKVDNESSFKSLLNSDTNKYKTQISPKRVMIFKKCNVPLGINRNEAEFPVADASKPEHEPDFRDIDSCECSATRSKHVQDQEMVDSFLSYAPSTNNCPICFTEYAVGPTQARGVLISRPQLKENEKLSFLHSFRVFGDLTFIFILLTQGGFFFIVGLVLTVIIDFAKDIGVHSSQQIYILISIAVPDIIGRLILGFITDSGLMTTTHFCGLCFLGFGFSCLLLALSTGFAMLMAVVAVYGIFSGALAISFPRVVYDNIKKEHLTMALASRYFLHPPMSLLVSPLIAHFRDKLQSYRGIFYILSTLCFIYSVLVFLIPCAARYRVKKQMQESRRQEETRRRTILVQ